MAIYSFYQNERMFAKQNNRAIKMTKEVVTMVRNSVSRYAEL